LKELIKELIKLQINYLRELNDKQRDIGIKSKAINAQKLFPYEHQIRKTNKESTATVALKSSQSSNEDMI
jgi:hypothetical protein